MNSLTRYSAGGSCGAVGDFDNNSHLDLFVARATSGNTDMLYRNDGGGVFTAVETATFNTPRDWSEAAAWGTTIGMASWISSSATDPSSPPRRKSTVSIETAEMAPSRR